MVELLFLGIIVIAAIRVLQRRREDHQDRLISAYSRAAQGRLSGISAGRSPTGIYSERFFNPR